MEFMRATRALGSVLMKTRCPTFLLLLCACTLGAVPVGHANTIVVNSILDVSDPGKCTLREAILAANTNTAVGACAAGAPYPAMDTISVGFARLYCLVNSCTITLTGPLPAITEDVTINGVSSFMTINGAHAYRVFDLQAVVVNISNMSILNGSAIGSSTAGYGGAINTSPSGTTLALTGMYFSGNHAQTRGGALYVPGGTVTVSNSTFDSNTVDSFGGAIDQTGGVLILSNSAITNNSASDGGGLEIQSASDTRVTNVTFSGNQARNNGGAISRIGTIYNLTLNNVTITNNMADSDNNGSGDGGGIYRGGGGVVASNTIIAGNFDSPNNAGTGNIHPDCSWANSGSLTSFGYNLIGRSDGCSGFTNGVNGDRTGTNASPLDARLGLLASNGGPTRTHALLPGSPAIDAANPALPGGGSFGACDANDQRGIARPLNGDASGTAICDIGAFEAPVPVATLDIDGSITATKYDALTDGLLAIRYLFGLTGPALTSNALGSTATRTDPVTIKAYLDSVRSGFDIDGNGTTDALTDGLLILRYLFGLRGPALIAGAVNPAGSRITATDIETYLQSLMP